MVGAGEAEVHCADPGLVPFVDRVPLERLAPAGHERTEPLLGAVGREHREPDLFEPVAQQHVEPVDVGAVVRVLVGDHDRAELPRIDVLLQQRERAVAAVHPDRGVTLPQEVAAARATEARPVRARGAEDGQLHRHASTCSTSGPRKRAPRWRKVSTSPEVTNSRATGQSRAVVLFPSMPRISNAVSSALDTRTTSRPITSPIVREQRVVGAAEHQRVDGRGSQRRQQSLGEHANLVRVDVAGLDELDEARAGGARQLDARGGRGELVGAGGDGADGSDRADAPVRVVEAAARIPGSTTPMTGTS